MSDRIAVFRDGAIEQVGAPADVYEHPANEFVAGFVGTSNIVERDGRRFTVRPEKVRDPRRRRAERWAARRGRPDPRRGLLGVVTRFMVELDEGGELQVVRQNLEMSSKEALEQRGKRVRVGWRGDHAYTIPEPQTTRRRIR